MNKKQWVGLLMVYVSYLFLGATIFFFLEHEKELEERMHKYDNYNYILATLKERFRFDEKSEYDLLIKNLENYTNFPFTENLTMDKVVPEVWDFYNAFFFVITVVSTIGYGNFHPSTDEGRVIMILYAIIGIPLNGILLTSLGQFFGAVFLKAHRRYKNHERYDTRWSLTVDILTYLLPGIILFIFLPAGVITYFEEWTYIEGVYYTFVTLTTIGFGDLVAGQKQYDVGETAVHIYKVLIFCWVIFGLGYIIMLLGFVAQGMNSKKIRKLEHRLLTGLTHSKMWNGFSKDIGYLRRLMNEIYLDKLKPVFHDDGIVTPPIIHRSKSLPDLSSLQTEEQQKTWRKRQRTMSENVTNLTRVFSESDLQRIDRNKTFAAAAAVPTTFELMRRVIDVYGGGQMHDWSSSSEEEDKGLRGIDGFSDEEVLASERPYEQQPTVTAASRHPSSIFYIPSYEDTLSRKPHRGRAMSECPPLDVQQFQPNMNPSGASDWTWSGPAANKLHDVIKQRSKHKLLIGLNKEKNTSSTPSVAEPYPFNPLRHRRRCVSDRDTSDSTASVNNLSADLPRPRNLAVPDLIHKRQSLQEGRLGQDVSRDPRYMTEMRPDNPLKTSGDFMRMYSRGENLFSDSSAGREFLDETSIGDFLRALTSLHSRVGERLVDADQQQPKPRRKMGTASLTPPRIRSLLDLFEPPSPHAKKRKPSAISAKIRNDIRGRRDSAATTAQEKPEKSESSHFKRFGRFLLRSYSIVPKDMEDIKPPVRKKRFSLWPTDSDSKDPPFQLQVDSPVDSRRTSADVVIPMEDSSSRRSSTSSHLRPQIPSGLAASVDSVFSRSPTPHRRISHPRWPTDSSLSDVKEIP